jgi:tripartite-type tricarboxylate transporter receptor subunit TctC
MTLLRHDCLGLVAGLVGLSALTQIGQAQTFPSRPITMIVGFAAGGPTDTIARLLAERMRISLGQNVLIENVTRANGSIGMGRVARASADGYT